MAGVCLRHLHHLSFIDYWLILFFSVWALDSTCSISCTHAFPQFHVFLATSIASINFLNLSIINTMDITMLGLDEYKVNKIRYE